MKFFSALAVILASTASAAPVAAPAGDRLISLGEAYTLSIKRSEALAQDAEAVAEALARVDELKGSVMPHLFLNGTETLQESPNSSSSFANQTSLPQVQLTLTQPLFSGFREFLAYKSGKKLVNSASLNMRRAQSLLYQDVSQAYLDLLRIQNEIEIRQSIIGATQERIKQLSSWIKIGRSRESESLAARSQLAQVQSQVEIARGQERVAQELLRFFTGLEDHLLPQEVAAPVLEPVEPFLDRARRRADVEAAKSNLESAGLTSEIARRQRWPTIGATGDYYLKRYGLSSNIHYDAIFAMSLPIFTGGLISAQVREAEAAQRFTAQTLSLAERTAQREVKSAYRGLEWSLAAVSALDNAAQLAEANTKAQAEDYRHSLVTNLDVLDSLNTLENTRIALNLVRQQSALARVQLEVAAGGPELPATGEVR